MDNYQLTHEGSEDPIAIEDLVAVEEVLPGLQTVGLPDGESWVGVLMFIKTQNSSGEPGWSIRRTDGLSDQELLGMLAVETEMLRDRIRFSKVNEGE